MKRTSDTTWAHNGWDVEYWGNGYRATRRNALDGKFETLTASSLAKAAILIDQTESVIKMVDHIVRGRK